MYDIRSCFNTKFEVMRTALEIFEEELSGEPLTQEKEL
jgi:hypothetical protein